MTRMFLAAALSLAVFQMAWAGSVDIIYGATEDQVTQLHFSGEIVEGDLERLVRARDEAALELGFCGTELGGLSCEITFSSPGGSLFIGMDIGRWIAENSIPTRIEAGSVCASACALAFLGGRFGYAVTSGPMKIIEANSYLGFHGFSSSLDEEVDLNEAFEVSRSLNAEIVQYAHDLGGIDLSWLSQVLNVPASSMYYVSSPYDIRSLGLSYEGPVWRRDDFAKHVCLNLARTELGYGWREEHFFPSNRFVDASSIIEELWRQRVPEADAADINRLRNALSGLSAYELSNLLGISTRFLEGDHAERFNLQHGNGFYKSKCFVIAHSDVEAGFSATIGSGWGDVRPFAPSWLFGHPYRMPLWPPCPKNEDCSNAEWAPGEEYHPYGPVRQIYPANDPKSISDCTNGAIRLGRLDRLRHKEFFFDLHEEFDQFVGGRYQTDKTYRHSNCHQLQIEISFRSVKDPAKARTGHQEALQRSARHIDADYRPFSRKNGFWIFVGEDPSNSNEFYTFGLFNDAGDVFLTEISYPKRLRHLGSEVVEAIACGARLENNGIRC